MVEPGAHGMGPPQGPAHAYVLGVETKLSPLRPVFLCLPVEL